MLLEERPIQPPRSADTTSAAADAACNNANYPTQNMCNTAPGDCAWIEDSTCKKKQWISIAVGLSGVLVILVAMCCWKPL